MKLHRSGSRSYSPAARVGHEAQGGRSCCEEDSEASTTTTEDDEDHVHPSSKQTRRLSRKKEHPHGSTYYKTLVCFAFSAVLVFLTLAHAYGATFFQSSRQATTPTTSISTYAGFLRFGGSGGDACPIPEWKYPDCRPFLKLQNATPPLTQEQWQRYRQAYYDAVGPDASSLPGAPWTLDPRSARHPPVCPRSPSVLPASSAAHRRGRMASRGVWYQSITA